MYVFHTQYLAKWSYFYFSIYCASWQCLVECVETISVLVTFILSSFRELVQRRPTCSRVNLKMGKMKLHYTIP